MPGAMLGGFVMGVVESLTKAYNHRSMLWCILIIVLLVKPRTLGAKRLKGGCRYMEKQNATLNILAVISFYMLVSIFIRPGCLTAIYQHPD